jgi:hypothetical protein
MSAEDVKGSPPAGGADGLEEGHSRAANDSNENRPVGDENQPPSFDYDAITFHVEMLFSLAQGYPYPGKLIVMALTAEQPAPYIAHFKTDDPHVVNRMVRWISLFDPANGLHRSSGIYCPWAIFHPDIPKYSKGRECDIVAVLAAGADIDADCGDNIELGIEPSAVLATSGANRQALFVYPKPLCFAEAKPVSQALHRLTSKVDDPSVKGDNAAKDCSRAWRVAGTLNCPSAAKITRGRDPRPARVHWVGEFGAIVDPAVILAAAGPAPERKQSHAAQQPTGFAKRKLRLALEALHPDTPPKEIGSPYYFWLQVGMAIHGLGWGDAGLEIWDRWSQRSAHYNEAELQTKWDSFDVERDERRTVGSIFFWAKAQGHELLRFVKPSRGRA